jgi:hypothetical protein
MKDEINHPEHYTQEKIECIDYIKQQLGDNFKYHLEACLVKYIHRHKHKNNPITDLKKAQWYLQKLIDEHCQDYDASEQLGKEIYSGQHFSEVINEL